ncbi:type VI secretion system-associated lipoprotein [Bordetella genomosp. 10]|uniref:Type VI secretion system-associated lipoprotein n=1 Tax=Bordetella genomosp. 10 TaxID=1416804 RepID=A0A261SIU2_9BORD|nr:type VI secretion system lipoprotein TssJ [Bordetella genomosp. 10]OZI37326.1 type VI secretion system-associated lipoprotein [Bordetella genomosp. 10]
MDKQRAVHVYKVLAACLAAALVLGACASTARRVAVPYAISFTADAQVNPDANGRPSPIQITVYELKSASTFKARDYFALQSNPQAALGAELLNTDQIILQPGQTEVIKHAGNVDAGAIGIVASYRDLEDSQWRLTVPLPEAENTNIYKFWQFSPNEQTVQIAVNRSGLAVTGWDRPWWPF